MGSIRPELAPTARPDPAAGEPREAPPISGVTLTEVDASPPSIFYPKQRATTRWSARPPPPPMATRETFATEARPTAPIAIVTLGATTLAVLLTGAVWVDVRTYDLMTALLVPATPRVWNGALWGLLTSSFVHEGWISLGLLIGAGAALGRVVERHLGHLRYGAFVLAACILTSGWHLLTTEVTTCGYGGVVTSLVGYLLARRALDPREAALLNRRALAIGIGWAILVAVAIATHLMTVAAGAPVAGLVFGALVAAAARAREAAGAHRRWLRVPAALGVLAMAGGVVVACAYMPWSERWRTRRESLAALETVEGLQRRAATGDIDARVELASIAAHDPAQRAQGLRVLRAAAQAGHPRAMNDYAWFLATCPDARFRDGPEAVKWASRAVVADPSPSVWDTVAAARAEVGDWDGALRAQRFAVRTATQLASADEAMFRAHLAQFERHEPIREGR